MNECIQKPVSSTTQHFRMRLSCENIRHLKSKSAKCLGSGPRAHGVDLGPVACFNAAFRVEGLYGLHRVCRVF